MPRTNSSTWSVNDAITATRLQDFNEDLDDIYVYGTDRGRVRTAISGTALKIDIAAFAWRVGSTSGQYTGGTDIAVTNTATNYVEIDATGTIQINTTGWTTLYGRLATVTCSGGVVTAISIWKVDVIGGSLGTSTLVNVETLSANKTIASTDKYYQLLNPDGTNRTATLETTNMSEGQSFYIKNNGTTGSLEVKQASTSLLFIPSGEYAIFTFDGTNWKSLYNPEGSGFYGDGSDGDVTISVDTTLTKDMYYNNLTVNSTKNLICANFRIFVKGTLTNNGIIHCNGGAGGNGGNASGATGGSAGSAGVGVANGYYASSAAGVAGGTGGNGGSGDVGLAGSAGSNGVAISNSVGGSNGVIGVAGSNGGAAGAPYSGAGGNGGAAGAVGTVTNIAARMKDAITAASGIVVSAGAVVVPKYHAGSGASGGGGGGGAGVTNTGGGGGGGGGSGGNAGILFIAAYRITGTGNFEAKGGSGGNGGNGANGSGSAASGPGGGGGGSGGTGGSGGLAFIIYRDYSGFTGTVSVAAGSAGSAGSAGNGNAGGANGTIGSAGNAGNAGVSFLLPI